VILLAFAVLAVAAAFAGAVSPEGPRLTILAQEYGREVIMIGPLGEDPQQIVDTKDVGPGASPSWSADGSRLAFSAEVYPDDDPVLGAVDADGGNLRIYPRTRLELGDPPCGATRCRRCVADAVQPGHWQPGSSAAWRRSCSGLTRIRSNSGE